MHGVSNTTIYNHDSQGSSANVSSAGDSGTQAAAIAAIAAMPAIPHHAATPTTPFSKPTPYSQPVTIRCPRPRALAATLVLMPLTFPSTVGSGHAALNSIAPSTAPPGCPAARSTTRPSPGTASQSTWRGRREARRGTAVLTAEDFQKSIFVLPQDQRPCIEFRSHPDESMVGSDSSIALSRPTDCLTHPPHLTDPEVHLQPGRMKSRFR